MNNNIQILIEIKVTNNNSNEKENIQKENKNMEKNPFFFGNLLTYKKNKNNINTILLMIYIKLVFNRKTFGYI